MIAIESVSFMDQHRALIIINNAAAKARRVWPVAHRQLQESRIKFEVYETTAAGSATFAARAAIERGARIIAVVGGDGTLSEVVEAFFDFNRTDKWQPPLPLSPQPVLAILPAGTGNDFARGLARRRAPLDHWLTRLSSYLREADPTSTRLVDVLYGICDGYTRPFICVNAATMGIGGETAARVAAQANFMRRMSGEIRFVCAAVGAVSSWRERPVRVSVDGQTMVECHMNLVAVANGLYAGGGMMLSPHARVDDGKLDVVAACQLTRVAVVRELLRIHKGGHMANPKVYATQGTQSRIETFTAADALLIEADGNVRGRTPVEFTVLPRSLRVVV